MVLRNIGPDRPRRSDKSHLPGSCYCRPCESIALQQQVYPSHNLINTIPMNERKEQVYAGLGHLFYSIAASDGRVSQEESAKLKKLVRNQWIPVEVGQDAAGTDLAYYIEIGFDHANEANLNADKAFDRFKQVHAEQAELFDLSTRNMVTRTAQAVADAFGDRSQHERRILEQLKEVFR